MKKLLLQLSVFSFFLIFGSCNEAKKEQVVNTPTKEHYASVFSDPIKIENPVVKTESARIKNTSVSNLIKEVLEGKKTGKRIPFQALLKANIFFTENVGQLERFENFYYPELGKVKFYSKAFCGTAYYTTNGIIFGFQRRAYRC